MLLRENNLGRRLYSTEAVRIAHQGQCARNGKRSGAGESILESVIFIDYLACFNGEAVKPLLDIISVELFF